MTYLPHLYSEEETRGFIRNVVLTQRETWVAEQDGRIVGFAAMSEGFLDHLYVDPAAQNRGIGSALLEVAKQRRPRGFRLWLFQKNDGARRFYERHGLTLVRLTDGRDNEEREPDALYEWTLERA